MSGTQIGIVRFPGTNCDQDVFDAVNQVEVAEPIWLWHKDNTVGTVRGIVLAGGFSYGDYLRAGAIARLSPIMDAVIAFARAGGPVLGICNGFQILAEAGLLPGALMRNDRITFVCRPQWLRIETTSTPFTDRYGLGDLVQFPVAHAEGNYVADSEVIRELQDEDRIVFRYVDAEGRPTADANPNGSMHDIAGIVNRERNVLGLMPHPDRAAEEILGSADGRLVFEGLAEAAA